jgi:hypothetical protein
MADSRYFCPDCGSIDLEITEKSVIISPDAKEGRAKCPNCGWEGTLKDTIGALTTEQFWDYKRVGDILMRVIAKHAAGPFVQVMEFVGLLPRKHPSPPVNPDGSVWSAADTQLHNELVDTARERILRAMLAATITAGFEESERVHRLWATKFNQPLHQLLQATPPAQAPKKDREFGGGNN